MRGVGSLILADSTQQRPFKLSVINLNITGLLEFLAKSELQLCSKSFVVLYIAMAIFFSALQQ